MENNNFLPYSRETFDMLSTFINIADVGLYVTDYYTCEVLLVNRQMASYSGVTDINAMIGTLCWSKLNPEGNGRCSFCPYEKLIDKDGNLLEPYVWELYLEPLSMWVKVINRAIIWPDGRLAHSVTFYDITESKTMREKLADLAFKDRLLGLKNEISLESDMQNAPVTPSLLVFDILSLQKVNEAYGRELGDDLLRHVRDWILERNIPNSELYRIGGDEFCLAIGDIEPQALNELANTLYRRFSEPCIFKHGGSKLQVFYNVSIAAIPGNFILKNDQPLDIIDRTLKIAKERRRIVVYDEVTNKLHKERLHLELELKRCVREDMEGFDVYYQPIADPVSGAWCGLEALCRWNSPEFGPVSPLLFIAEAERLELIGAIGFWILETSIRECKKWGLDKNRDFLLDVNVSAVQFLDETLADVIVKILERCGYPGEKLCLEITESTQFTFTDQPLNIIEQLRNHGILMALDDFGTGYSSFNNLKSLPVDIVKIEREFIKDIETNEYHQYLFRAMAELVHKADKKLIAEGVERKEQMDILVKSGADCLQGYLFSKPLTPDNVEKQLSLFNPAREV